MPQYSLPIILVQCQTGLPINGSPLEALQLDGLLFHVYMMSKMIKLIAIVIQNFQ